DYFDPADKFEGKLDKAFKEIEAQLLVVSFSTDWRFSPARSKEIVNALIKAKKDVSYMEIDSPHGHDSFLFANKEYVNGLSSFLEN
ncbi:homoserine O-acetyltransferase, partial [Gammaproteobacteria bacterium]|nr:homoserine O-acetyltransferase [Gammaproteobacteria bacterium]